MPKNRLMNTSKSYPKDTGNREMVVFHRASNSLIRGKMREAAEQVEDFLKEYPEIRQVWRHRPR